MGNSSAAYLVRPGSIQHELSATPTDNRLIR